MYFNDFQFSLVLFITFINLDPVWGTRGPDLPLHISISFYFAKIFLLTQMTGIYRKHTKSVEHNPSADTTFRLSSF